MKLRSITLSRASPHAYQLTFWGDGVARCDAVDGPRPGAWQGRVDARWIDRLAPLVESLPPSRSTSPVLTIVAEDEDGRHHSFRAAHGREATELWLVSTLLDGMSANTTWAPLDVTEELDLNDWAEGISMSLRQGSCVAQGLARPEGIVVLAGSIVSPSTSPTLEENYKHERAALVSSGALVLGDHDRYVLQRHLWFQAPSASASVLAGSNTNGRKAWRDRFGRPWSEVFS